MRLPSVKTHIRHADLTTKKKNMGKLEGKIALVDETSQSLQEKFPRTDVFGHIEVADGRIWLKPSGIVCFAGDLSEQEQKLVWATEGVADVNLFNQKLEGPAWRLRSALLARTAE
jgi:hypothetical protein